MWLKSSEAEIWHTLQQIWRGTQRHYKSLENWQKKLETALLKNRGTDGAKLKAQQTMSNNRKKNDTATKESISRVSEFFQLLSDSPGLSFFRWVLWDKHQTSVTMQPYKDRHKHTVQYMTHFDNEDESFWMSSKKVSELYVNQERKMAYTFKMKMLFSFSNIRENLTTRHMWIESRGYNRGGNIKSY